MAWRHEITQINISVFLTLSLLAALIAATVFNLLSENLVLKVAAQDHSVTAIHERGYAVLTTKLPAGGNILEITIEWSWSILGSIAHTPATGGFGTVERRVRSMS